MDFHDSVGRCFTWKFMPKDYPGSDQSVHHNTQLALQNVANSLRLAKQVRVRRDVVLIMGRTRRDWQS
jgi:hypothetical protein